ncbi:DUF418 domain-containing protein [Promicromonospora sp. NPDC023805]|uniref:DUF418 domain-containing protein n=1 Tax=Promicromonospora sp. NPDC023805 TaxID=3154696 RepID=UPI0033EF8D0D
MIGSWAACRQLLENPGEHLALLRRVAYCGIGLGVLGGVPAALIDVEVWQPGQTVDLGVSWLHLVTGYAGGFGYAAAIALISRRFGERSGSRFVSLFPVVIGGHVHGWRRPFSHPPIQVERTRTW